MRPGRRAICCWARKLIAQAAHAAEAARHAQKGETGIIKIGIAAGLGGVVNRMVSAFRKRSSSVEVECRDVFSNFQSDALRKREIDVGFLRPPLDHINLECEHLYQEEFVVIMPKNQPSGSAPVPATAGDCRGAINSVRQKFFERAL